MTDVDTYYAERALKTFRDAIPEEVWTPELSGLYAGAERQLTSIECEGDHATYHEESATLSDLANAVGEKLQKLRLGVYREDMDGDLLATLEEIERLLT